MSTVAVVLCCLIDIAAERKRLMAARDKAAGEVRKVVQKLANVDFVRRAPEEVVEENRERQASSEAEDARIEAALARIG